MKNKREINEILSLRREKYSIRQIAERLKMSKTTVHKYIKIAPSVEEVQPALKIGGTEVTGGVTNNPNDIDWPKLFRDEPLGSTMVQGMSSSEFPNAYDPVQDYPRRRGIRFEQPYMESNNYPEELNYGDQYYAPRRRGIPVPPRKQRTPEKSTVQIKKEFNDQEQAQKLQLLEKKLDRIDKREREKREFEKKSNEILEKKLAIDQNKKTEFDNLKKISTTNQDKENKIISHVTELQKTKKSIEQKNLTNHESTVTDKNLLIHDSNVDKSAVLGTEMAPLLLAKIFEGASPFIGSLIVHKLNKVKFNNITPKKVMLIPAHNNNTPQKIKIIHPIKVDLREVKKEDEVNLIPLDK